MFPEGEQVKLGENMDTPVTPPAAICTPEQSRQFQPRQASPSFVFSPRGSPDREVMEEIRQAEIVFNLGNRSASDDINLKEVENLDG